MSAGCALLPAPEPIFAQDISSKPANDASASRRTVLVKLQHRHERFLRDLNRPHTLHPSLSFLLLLEQLAFPGDVASVTLWQYVLAHRRNRLASDHLTADGGLDWNFIELAAKNRLQLLHQPSSLGLRLAAVRDQGKGVHRLARDQHVELYEFAFPEADHLVVHRRIALGAGLQLVVEVVDDLAERGLVLDHDPVARAVLQPLEHAPPS